MSPEGLPMSFDRTTLIETLQPERRALGLEDAAHWERVVDALAAALDEQGRLDAPGLRALEQATFDPQRRSRRRHRAWLRRLLQRLNQTGRIEAVLPVTPILEPRPSTLAVSPEQLRCQMTAAALDAYLDPWLRARSGADSADRLFALAVRLATRAGMGERVVVGTLARLRWADVDQDGTLALPIEPTDFSGAVHPVRPPKACRKHLPPRPRAAGDRLVAAPVLESAKPPDDAATVRAYERMLRRWLRDAFAAFAADFERERLVPGATVRGWQRFAHAGRLLPLAYGVPAAWVELLAAFPLPAAARTGTGARLDWSVQTAQRRPGDRLLRPAAHHGPGPGEGAVERPQPGPIGDDPMPRPEDWPRRARNLLDAFIARMRALQTARGTLPARARDEALAACKALLERADALGYPASIVQLALAWGADKLLRDGVKVQTLADYYSRIASPELLGMEEVLDLRDWDDETIEEVTGCVVAARRWSPRSAEHFRTTWFELLRYGQQAGGWLAEAEFALSTPREGAAHAPARTAIVTPAEFEYAHGVLVSREHDARYAQWAAALTLGFYAGVRASEVCALTLGDLFVDATECWVEIRSGKTPAARRRIPLHALAPPGPMAQIKGWAQRRRQQFPQERAQDVALFGPEGNARGYRHHGLIAPLLEVLRPILGEGVDFHLLRHSMVTWLLLRWHAAQYRDFRDQLLERDAWMFSDTALERLPALRQPEALASTEGLGGEAWLALAKLVGHRDPGTLLLYYGHSLGPIHSDVLARAWGGRPGSRS
ncbi:hypothetical protein CKO15_11080 [Halorhodospira abdelmalekii]|nr:hypothetical protein [Halorhodospira abdelmalekii]